MGWIPPEQAALWTGGQWTEDPGCLLAGAIQDTRLLKPGMLYVALKGARVDGHDFLDAAVEAGAAAALCEAGRSSDDLPCLEVRDPGEALLALASGWRQTLKAPLVGITGSAGKTTAKEVLRAMLASRGSVAATRGNWNNAIGLPLSLLSMTPEDQFGVFEVGMNQPGEIAQLAGVLKPTSAWVTSIGEAHLEKLGTLEAIAAEKASLLTALSPDGLAVVDVDSPWSEVFESELRCRVVRCSFEQSADVTGKRVEGAVKVRAGDQDMNLPVPGVGEHMCRNVLQAAAMAWGLGLSLQEISKGLKCFEAPPMRWQEIERDGQLWINDAYNANPLSMRAAVSAFQELSDRDEKWLILGGMAELGAASEDLHLKLGLEVSKGPWSGVICVGTAAKKIRDGVGPDIGQWVESPEDALTLLTKAAGPRAAILVKGSRAAALERLFDPKVFTNQKEPIA